MKQEIILSNISCACARSLPLTDPYQLTSCLLLTWVDFLCVVELTININECQGPVFLDDILNLTFDYSIRKMGNMRKPFAMQVAFVGSVRSSHVSSFNDLLMKIPPTIYHFMSKYLTVLS